MPDIFKKDCKLNLIEYGSQQNLDFSLDVFKGQIKDAILSLLKK
jgi:hypothetical protein